MTSTSNIFAPRLAPYAQVIIAIAWAVPLAIATGAGAASQRAIGTGVIGGMLTATLLGVIFVPIFFVWVLSLFSRKSRAGDDTAASPKTPVGEQH